MFIDESMSDNAVKMLINVSKTDADRIRMSVNARIKSMGPNQVKSYKAKRYSGAMIIKGGYVL